jgi:hypothetical protein
MPLAVSVTPIHWLALTISSGWQHTRCTPDAQAGTTVSTAIRGGAGDRLCRLQSFTGTGCLARIAGKTSARHGAAEAIGINLNGCYYDTVVARDVPLQVQTSQL